MPITFMRHTRPDVADGICYGQLDLNVAPNFQVDAKAALAALDVRPERLVSSPLKRCKTLSEFIGKATNLKPVYDLRLAEISFGSWEGTAWDDIPRAEIDAWAKDFAYARPHGGENVAQFKARVDDAVSVLKASSQQILIVTHAGVIRAAMAKTLAQEDFSRSIGFGHYVHLNG